MAADAAPHVYLVRASDRLVCHCRCDPAYITFPPQMDCPWCGCGWLFTCTKCRKAFTFARGIVLNEPWRATALRDLAGKWGRDPEEDEIEQWIEAMQVILKDVVEGQEYVCVDGWVIGADEEAVVMDGWHSRHELPFVPHVAALTDPEIMESILSNRDYWHETQLADPEE
jgi:hypothetical protein